jgi:hypothetical protein
MKDVRADMTRNGVFGDVSEGQATRVAKKFALSRKGLRPKANSTSKSACGNRAATSANEVLSNLASQSAQDG